MNFLSELKRRNVVRVAIAYLVMSWLLVQVVDIVVDALSLPDWLPGVTIVLLGVGFPLALFLAWAFELTPEGVKKTEEVDADASIAHNTGHKLNYLIMAGLVLALGYFMVDKFMTVSEVEIVPLEVAAVEKSIAVLPFADLSAAGDQEYFGDGMAEEILNRLSGIEGLEVTSRTTAFSLKGENLSIPEIADRLDVNYIIEGSIRRAGTKVRVTGQLIEVASDSHLWSGTYDREMEDIFVIQDEISQAITNALQVQLMGESGKREVPTENLEAYNLYLQGHQLFLMRGAENIERGMKLLEAALALDPSFAEAWADLASSLVILPFYDITRDDDLMVARALEAANKAIELNPGLAQGWAAKGFVSSGRREWRQAISALERSVALNPNNETGWMWLGAITSDLGHFEKADGYIARAIEIAPVAGINFGVRGRNFLRQGNYDAARAALDRALALGWWPAHFNRASVALQDGDAERAVDDVWANLELLGGSPNDRIRHYVMAYFDPAQRADARRLVQQDLREGNAVQAAWGSLLLGDGDTFTSLTRGELIVTWLEFEMYIPAFRPILNQPAVKGHLEQEGLIDYWRKFGWPDFCHPLGEDDFECGATE